MQLDLNSEFGARVARRLENEQIIWLSTVRSDLLPQPSPVWFLWDGAEFLIYSQPKTQKLRNIAVRPLVSLHFDGDGQGGNIVVFSGEARVDQTAPAADAVAAYVTKYEQGIKRINLTPSTFAQAYSVALRVVPTGLRGY